VATVPIGQGVDANVFDPEMRLVFSSCGDGSVTIAREETPEKFTVIQDPRDRTRRANDGARSQDASDIPDQRPLRSPAGAAARRAAAAPKDRSGQHEGSGVWMAPPISR